MKPPQPPQALRQGIRQPAPAPAVKPALAAPPPVPRPAVQARLAPAAVLPRARAMPAVPPVFRPQAGVPGPAVTLPVQAKVAPRTGARASHSAPPVFRPAPAKQTAQARPIQRSAIVKTVGGSGFVGAVGTKKHTLQDASDLFKEFDAAEIQQLNALLDQLNHLIGPRQTAPLRPEHEHQIRRIFRDMEALNYGFNPELKKLWEEASDDITESYRNMRRRMTPQLEDELPEVLDTDFFRRPEIHHATYQSVVKAYENTPHNLYLSTRGGRDIVGQHDALHRISSAGHGSPWKTLVPAIQSIIEDETGMASWTANSRPQYLFARRQVELTDDRVARVNLNKLVAEAQANADAGLLRSPTWDFRILPK